MTASNATTHAQDPLALDQRHREQAIALDSFIVEAPAGAGKTELLTQRYLRLLTQVRAPEEIIAITFTNKAASEMRQRILENLERAASHQPPDAPHRQMTYALAQAALEHGEALHWQLLASPARLRIYTIDALCGNLARQMPLLSRFGTQPSVIDDARRYYREVVTRVLSQLNHPDYGEAVTVVLRYFDNNQQQLTELLVAMLGRREQWQAYASLDSLHHSAELALHTLLTQALQGVLTHWPARVQEALMPFVRFAASQLPPDHAITPLAAWTEPLTAAPEQVACWQALAQFLLTDKGQWRKTLTVKNGFPPTPEAKPMKEGCLEWMASYAQHTNAIASLATVRTLPLLEAAHEHQATIDALSTLLKVTVAELWLTFQRRREVDFVEVARCALAALKDSAGDSTELAMRLDYRIQHLLVDEFQDTSPLQVQLLEALTAGWQPGDGRTLFCVGDPMQSIYRFRKAEVGEFLRVSQQGVGDVALTALKLWRNNRSCPAIIDWINQCFAGLFPAEDHPEMGAIHYRPFIATREMASGQGVFVHPFIKGETPSVTADEGEETALEPESPVRWQEAEQIIRIIHATRAEAPQAKIAVLVRARRHLDTLVSLIRRHYPTLSFQAVEIEQLANRQIVQDLLTLTHALMQPADRVHWLALLRAPWCGLTLADLHALAGTHKKATILSLLHDPAILAQLSEDGRQRAQHVAQVMHQALALRGRTSRRRWIETTWLSLGGAESLWVPNDVHDVQAFFDRIDALERTGQFSAQHLAEDVQKLYAAPDAKADDSLQFMTIHKSKGLEFDTVILPGLDSLAPPPDHPLVLWEEVNVSGATPRDGRISSYHRGLLAAPYQPKGMRKHMGAEEHVSLYDYLQHLEKQRGTYEDARVLYVAATRAIRCLHLLGVATRKKDGSLSAPKGSFLAMLWPAVAHRFTDAAERSVQTEAGLGVQGEAHAATMPTLEADVQAPPPNAHPTQANDIAHFVPQLIRLRKVGYPPRLHPFVATEAVAGATDSHREKVASEGALRQGLSALISANAGAQTLEADIGTLTHRYLQWMAEGQKQGKPLQAWLDNTQGIAACESAMQRWFQQRGYSPDDVRAAAHRVITLLRTTLNAPDGAWVLADHPQGACELPMEMRFGDDDTLVAIEASVIDRTFVIDGTRWIIDYKTAAIEGLDDLQCQQHAEQYRPQLERYAKHFKDTSICLAVLYVARGRLVRLPTR